MDIIIVGGGIGGLTAALVLAKDGHKVRVFEGATQFREIGAGITLSANSLRLLERWGVDIDAIGIQGFDAFTLHRWSDGSPITGASLDTIKKDYGYPFSGAHRADYHTTLLNKARATGVQIELNSRVQTYGFDNGQIVLVDGRDFSADLIIAADGLRSTARRQMFYASTDADDFIDTGLVANRTIIPREKLANDPELAHLVQKSEYNVWVGPDAYTLAYPIKNGDFCNVIFYRKADGSESLKDGDQLICDDLPKFRDQYTNWDPSVQKLLSHINNFITRKVKVMKPLDTWVHPSGRVVLLGDACRGMAALLGQGSAQATEDAAVLASVLHHTLLKSISPSPSQLHSILKQYEHIRRRRTDPIRRKSNLRPDYLLLPDGSDQQERDIRLAKHDEQNPLILVNSAMMRQVYSYDAEADAKDQLVQLT